MMMFPNDIIVIDVETTGLNPARDGIIELAACHLSGANLAEVRAFHSRVRTSVPVSRSAYAVHGISASDLDHEPELAEVVGAFLGFAPSSAILCGHNVAFDAGFLRA